MDSTFKSPIHVVFFLIRDEKKAKNKFKKNANWVICKQQLSYLYKIHNAWKNSNYTCLLILTSKLLLAQTYTTKVTVADIENQKLIPNQTVVITIGAVGANINSIKV